MNIQTQLQLITVGHARHMAVADLHGSRSKAERRNRKRALRQMDREVRSLVKQIAAGRG